MGNTLCNGVYDAACYEIGAVLWPVDVCVCVSMFQLNSPMNSVSSTEDIKPPLGINGVMKVPAQPSGTSLSLSKHICTICGDRSSGEWAFKLMIASLAQDLFRINVTTFRMSFFMTKDFWEFQSLILVRVVGERYK